MSRVKATPTKRLKWVNFLTGVLLGGFYPLWMFGLLQRGFDLPQVAALLGVCQLIAISLDVPSSWMADKFGHQRIVFAGLGILVLGFFMPILSVSPYLLVATVAAEAVAAAMIGGPMQTITAIYAEKESQGINNHSFFAIDQIQRVGMIIGALLLPAIASLSNSHLQLSWLGHAVIGVFLIVSLMRLPNLKRNFDSAPKPNKSFNLKNFKIPYHSVLFFTLLLLSYVLFGVTMAGGDLAYYPQLIELSGREPMYLGFAQAALAVSRYLGVELWKKTSIAESAMIIPFSIALSSLFFLGFNFVDNLLLATVVWMFRVGILSAYFPARDSFVQQAFRGKNTAVICSVLSTAELLGAAAFFAYVSKIQISDASRVGVTAGLVSVVCAVTFSLALLQYRRKQLKLQRQII